MAGPSGRGLKVVVVPAGSEASPRLLSAVARAARLAGPSVLWSSDARGHGAAVWSRAAARAPLVVHRRVTFPPGRDLLSRLKYRSARRYVAISREVGRVLGTAGVPEGRITVIPDGLPRDAYVDRPRPDGPPYHLVHVGAFDGMKGQEVAVRALSRLLARGLDATLTLLGDGPARAVAERIASAEGVASRCVFTGEVRDVPERLAASHLFLLPSRSEGAALSLAEAMAAGCPALVHDLPGPREFCRDGACVALVPSLDPGTWSEAVARLLLDPAERSRLSAAGRAAAASWTLEESVARLEAVLETA
jgi:glycosyltransferase involved in cell wall biosynthesis